MALLLVATGAACWGLTQLVGPGLPLYITSHPVVMLAVITADPLPVVQADAHRLTHVFQNLIANAIKFRATRTPEIQIGARRQDGAWLLWVRDNGIGIEPQYHERIFTIFQCLHTRTKYPGTGIGWPRSGEPGRSASP